MEVVLHEEGAADQLIDRCKTLPEGSNQTLVNTLAVDLGVSLPVGRVVVNWDEGAKCLRGISFGSHSCSLVSMTTITSLRSHRSWYSLGRYLSEQACCFCYPNGNSNGDPSSGKKLTATRLQYQRGKRGSGSLAWVIVCPFGEWGSTMMSHSIPLVLASGCADFVSNKLGTTRLSVRRNREARPKRKCW